MSTDYLMFNHSQKWAMLHAGADIATASRYASWYVENYPEGDKSHAGAFWYWKDSQDFTKREGETDGEAIARWAEGDF